MSRNYTRELRRAKEQGAKIVCSVAPYHGHAVVYAPRRKGDPQPWNLAELPSMPEYRYSGRECHAVAPVPASGTETPSTT